MKYSLKLFLFICAYMFIGSCATDKSINTNEPDNHSNTLTSPIENVEINNLPEIKNIVVNQNGDEKILRFDILDDDETVAISLYGRKLGDTDYTNISSLFSGDIGSEITVGNQKTIISELLSEYEELELRVTDIEAFRKHLTQTVSKNRIEFDVEQLNGIRHHTSPGLLNQTRTYVQEEFIKYQLDASMHYFDWNAVSAANVIGQLKGDTEDTYIICAHFDTVRNSPGADDNASGTAGLLEAMRVLSQYEFENSITFIGFDLEEHGLIGSREYVNEIANHDNIKGVINFEMIGYPCISSICENLPLSDTSIYNIALPEFTSLRIKFDEMGSKYVPNLKITSVEADGDPNFRRSDHAPFWSVNIPALFITDGANFRNPHYHQTSDTSETLDYDFSKNIVATAILTITDLAKINRTTSVRITL